MARLSWIRRARRAQARRWALRRRGAALGGPGGARGPHLLGPLRQRAQGVQRVVAREVDRAPVGDDGVVGAALELEHLAARAGAEADRLLPPEVGVVDDVADDGRAARRCGRCRGGPSARAPSARRARRSGRCRSPRRPSRERRAGGPRPATRRRSRRCCATTPAARSGRRRSRPSRPCCRCRRGRRRPPAWSRSSRPRAPASRPWCSRATTPRRCPPRPRTRARRSRRSTAGRRTAPARP